MYTSYHTQLNLFEFYCGVHRSGTFGSRYSWYASLHDKPAQRFILSCHLLIVHIGTCVISNFYAIRVNGERALAARSVAGCSCVHDQLKTTCIGTLDPVPVKKKIGTGAPPTEQ